MGVGEDLHGHNVRLRQLEPQAFQELQRLGFHQRTVLDVLLIVWKAVLIQPAGADRDSVRFNLNRGHD